MSFAVCFPQRGTFGDATRRGGLPGRTFAGNIEVVGGSPHTAQY
jgi:hypothetical protein